MEKEHRACSLLSADTVMNASPSDSSLPSSRPKRKSNSEPVQLGPTGRPKRSPPQAKLYEPGESTSAGKKTAPRESSSSAKKKAPKQSLPLCKCPSCDKVLAPQGIYGHFGRVHSGQLDNGEVSRFEWSKVRYACPFCPSSDKPKIFSSLDTLDSHVDKSHAMCEVIRPNMNPKGTAMKSDRELTTSSKNRESSSSRKSERERPKRTSFTKDDYEEVPEVKPTYDCPKCDKKGMTKQGLHTHYGMVHGGKVNMKQVKVNLPGKSRRAAAKKVAAREDTTDDDSGDGYRIGPWSDEEHDAFIEGHKKFGNRWKLISEEFVPTRDAKQIGSHALNYFTTRGKWNGGRGATASTSWDEESSVAEESVVERRPVRTKKGHKRGEKQEAHSPEEGEEDSSEMSDDGNSGYCIVCYEGGEIICCSKCPRAYHSKCLAKDGGNSVSIDYLPRNWRCKRCKRDKEVSFGEELANKFYAFGDKKIRSAYADYKGCSDFATCCALLSMISEILTKLKNYDYGYYFSEPVDMESVTDYLDFVDTPVDYNIISERLESGSYADHIISTDGEKSIMEDILLHVLCDIDRVHLNCKVYNEKGACGTKAILRVGEIHRSKWNAFFRQYIADRLPEKVQDDFHDFRQKGEFGGKGAAAARKKRRSSQGEEQRKSKRAKQDASTSALLLSAGQVSALEHVFFASPAVLQQESDAEDAKAQASLGDASSFSASISTELSKSFGPEKVSSTLMDGARVSTRSNASRTESTANQKSWFERLRDLKAYKITHGTAVCTPAVNEKLYHWRLRQRKRYHLTLNRLPQLRSEESQTVLNGRNEDRQWLLTVPEMKGVYSLSSTPMNTIKPRNFAFNSTDGWTIAFVREEDVAPDNQTAALLRTQHELTLYGPELSGGSPRNYWNWYRTSLFWDECMEGLRFFYDEHQHTIVPRSDPEPIFPLWVESQRAKYLLQQDGVWSGLTTDQINALKEVKIADFSALCEDDDDMEGDENSYGPDYEDGRNGRKMNVDSESKKSWGAHLNDFKVWYESLSEEEKPYASDLLAQTDWSDYSWCWRQCHAASALLCGTPNVKGITMSVKKLKLLARAGFFHAFPYNGRNGLVDEDDYEGNASFDSTFHTLEDFSIKYGSTHIPDWYDCDAAFRMWISALHNGIVNFAKGDACVLSTPQIEKLILIGFCNDRDNLSNLSRGDVIWLKNLFELKRYRDLFGDCNVTSEFPHLHEWVDEQKELFRLTRAGKRDMIHASRLEMLRDAGLDFFTGECLPNTVSENEVRSFCQFISSPDNVASDDNSTQNDLYWKGRQFNKDFEALKSRGTSSVLANEHEELYRWFVERRGKLLLMQQKSGDGSLWDNYFERLAMFKAAEGHLNIPDDYPDKALLMWLSRQQDILHLYSAGQPLEILPTRLKKLIAIGVCESKRMGPAVKMSSRTMKRKFPSKKVVLG